MKRLDLHKILTTLLNCPENGAKCRAYFQPGANTTMRYPAIRYTLNDIDIKHADDNSYLQNQEYMLTLIDKDSDSPLVMEISKLPHIRFNRYYASNNLNHWVYTIY